MTGRASDDDPARLQHHVCLVVPHGTHRPQALADALAGLHPDVVIGAIWCGDPHLRPPASRNAPWWDVPTDDDWHDVLVADPAMVAEWRGGLRQVRRLLAGGVPSVTLLWVGSVAVLGDVSVLWAGASTARAGAQTGVRSARATG